MLAKLLSKLCFAILLSVLMSACTSRYDAQGRIVIGVDELFQDKTFNASLRVEETEPFRVYLEKDGSEKVIGVLSYQFPDLPVRTVIFPVGYGYIMVGQVDETVQGKLFSISIQSNPFDQETKTFILRNEKSQVFSLPIYPRERLIWQSIWNITITTDVIVENKLESTYLSRNYKPPIVVADIAEKDSIK